MAKLLESLMEFVKWVISFLVVAGFIGGCLTTCRAVLPESRQLTAEEISHTREMNVRLSNATVGDFLLLKDYHDFTINDQVIWVVRWHNQEQKILGIASLTGGFSRFFVDEEDYRLEDVILKDDSRWSEYRDRLLFGKSATSQPTTTQSD